MNGARKEGFFDYGLNGLNGSNGSNGSNGLIGHLLGRSLNFLPDLFVVLELMFIFAGCFLKWA